MKSITPVQRRKFAIGASAIAAASLFVHGQPAQAQSASRKRTFVLVHGAWHGGWCWKQVSQELAQEGHTVYAPSLTGLADRSHLMREGIGLQTHIADIVNLIKWDDLNDVVLVGHSYAGMVITGVAGELKNQISSIIYLDALIPAQGQGAADLTTAGVKAALQRTMSEGKISLPAPPATAFKLLAQNEALVTAKVTAQPIATLLDPSPADIRKIDIAKKTFVRLQKYPHGKLDEYVAEIKQLTSWNFVPLDVGHDMMVDHPAQLAKLLVQYS